MATQGRSLTWSHTFPTDQAYRTAISRMRKNGLLIKVYPKDALPRLILTDSAKDTLPAYQRPEKFWNTKWNGIWYTLIFDVPEKERIYRDTLRRILRKMRMGCLQRSVWITPQDIRPEYTDLEKTAAIGTVAYLLESRTVLHLDQQEMVQNAWNFDRLHQLQSRYINVFTDNLKQLEKPIHSETELMDLLHQESDAYIQAMQFDPLLPKTLHPSNYLGPKVWSLRNQLRTKMIQIL